MLKSILFLFWTTMLGGVVLGLLTWGIGRTVFSDFVSMDVAVSGASEIGMIILATLTMCLISVVGYVGYLMTNYYMIGILRSRKGAWSGLQLFFIALAIANLFFLRYTEFAEGRESLGMYLGIPALIIAAGLIVSQIKVSLTNSHARIPTLFFIIVVTSLEMLPAFSISDLSSLLYVAIVLLGCNAWQILIFHKLTNNNRAGAKAPANAPVKSPPKRPSAKKA
ncbi:KinB-signaling pathway activation protein [Paenibacillus lutrae]|uniref:KinB-signaling pathway activation family protein n=1 Tax=Paenibacillus lutrae TaxID=2078573 RepID=A0A7X3JZQ9_9BACL|nr:KinB-signaling pathway activation protein [Paenibacillus lutrae]MVP00201.1 KinB-signaling pathway activation family protein [Paenibacillus lutrae]